MLPDLEPFFDRLHVLCPDTRGHGLSDKFERAEDYTYARKAEDLLLWLDHLGIERPIWGGVSMGAALSLWTAVHAPGRVRAVVSISGPPFAPVESDRQWWATHRRLVVAGDFDAYFDANVRLRMGEDALARLKARPERYGKLVDRLRTHSVASLLALLDETYSRSDWIGDCARIRCPLLVIGGSEDHFPTPEMSTRGGGDGSRCPALHRARGAALPQSHAPRGSSASDRRVLGRDRRDVMLRRRGRSPCWPGTSRSAW
jgi:pimeloyl-ACP methyl ester carboxylesterase